MGDTASKDTLIIYVPGYTDHAPGVRLRGYVRWAMDNPDGEISLDPLPRPEERAFQGYPGLRYTLSEPYVRHVDFVEVSWDTQITKLTGSPPIRRIPRGALLLWLNFWSASKLALTNSRGFALATGIGLAVMFLWFYLVLASALGGIVGALPKSGVEFASGLGWIHVMWHDIKPGSWAFAGLFGLAAVLSAFQVEPGAIANIADLYDRFTHNTEESESYIAIRSMLVDLVRDAVVATNADSYARTIILGHSFGALISCAAIPKIVKKVDLMTIGTYFAYLDKFDGVNMEKLFRSALSANVAHWYDYFSDQDWLASSAPYTDILEQRSTATSDEKLVTPRERYKAQKVGNAWNVRLCDKLTARTHRYYFRDPQVIAELFREPEPVAAS